MRASYIFRMGGGSGMNTAQPNVSSVQDMPPKGGYPRIDYTRRIGNRGPPGWAIWGGILFATAYGFYQISVTNSEKRNNLKEKRESRMAILPFIQAEEDRKLIAEINESNKVEAEIMKDVPGWKVGESSYSKRYSPPVYYRRADGNDKYRENKSTFF